MNRVVVDSVPFWLDSVPFSTKVGAFRREAGRTNGAVKPHQLGLAVRDGTLGEAQSVSGL